MKTMLILFAAGILAAFAVKDSADSDLKRMQGEWTAIDDEETVVMVVAKNNLEYRNPKTGEWFKAEFSLDPSTSPKQINAMIKEGAIDEFKGKESLGIYRFADGRLEIAACRPGETEGPKDFDDPRCRRLEFTHD
ncbi:TIGR03067 domain-containing protein [Crateriforma conspicua]|uniref:TIGR03067 domain-containing protein n=1 Tax=Crateriforma conspicua TaxID=2527996 RepID=A0A5C5Y6P4_9PLAN|nr:TIGR03067 domain-containing protein [Crateriforma conspicua]QDV65181.1 hypothetical protein Mal65_43510 [Crateriforma conspicua]TWT70578.1 hypothetical protein Pan14r_28850 [Crateriforma conspicua]